MGMTNHNHLPSNIRMICAVYFGLLALIGTIIIDSILYFLGVSEILPIFKSILLSCGLAALSGSLFAYKIMTTQAPYTFKTFCWGFLMVMAALPIYNLVLILMLAHEHVSIVTTAVLYDYLSLYFIYLFFLFLFAGLWLGIAGGVAAVYLRGHFVHDLEETQDIHRPLPIDKQKKTHRSDTPHRKRYEH